MADLDANEVIFDELIQINLDLARLDATIRRKVLRLLRAMQKELISSIGNDSLTEWGLVRKRQQLRETKEIITKYFNNISAVTLNQTQSIPQIAATSASQALAVSVGSGVGGAVAGLIPTTNFLDTLAKNALIEGATQGDWWKKQSVDMIFRFEQAINLGLINAETNQQIIKRVLSIDGVTIKNAEKLVRTTVLGISNQARQKSFEQNESVIAAYVHTSVLDNRTCVQCAPRDGLEWTVNHQPIGHDIPWRIPPIHTNCRCSLYARTKTFRELGVDLDEIGDDERSSMEGMVTDKSFGNFMDRKGKAFTENALGKGRADLYRSGVITLEQLIDGNGNLVSVKALRAKYLK